MPFNAHRCERERSPIPGNITIKAVCRFQFSDQTIIAAVVAIVAEWDAQPAKNESKLGMPSTGRPHIRRDV